MDFAFVRADLPDLSKAFSLLEEAAKMLQEKGVDQWQCWLSPNSSDIKWVQEGFEQGEFYFLEHKEWGTVGMVRIQVDDVLYWGKQEEQALYVHSLIIRSSFSGKGIGVQVIDRILGMAAKRKILWLRLDCNSSNPRLCKYYEDQNFKQVGTKHFEDFSCNLYQRKVF